MIISLLISPVEQAAVLAARYPNAEVRLFSSQLFFSEPNFPQSNWQMVLGQVSAIQCAESIALVCDINLRPTAMSREYWVRIIYKIGERPMVYVKFPKLIYKATNPLPHFNLDNTLCLYHSSKEWNETMVLADTIVPWTSEWLFHYEIWKSTEAWHGGGV